MFTLFSTLLAQFDGSIGPIEGPVTQFQPAGDDATAYGASLQVIENILSLIIGLITTAAGLAFLLFFIFGALQWITAAGDQGKVEAARKQMTNGAIGLVIIIMSFAIVGVVGSVLGLDILDPAGALSDLRQN